jgi:hypothetical protein
MKVFQSDRDAGEKIFMPLGQLFFCVDLYTLRHCEHFSNSFAEYGPASCTFVHLQDEGLPGAGFFEKALAWQ